MSLSLSRRLAVIIGILLPLAEIVRRWQAYPPAVVDDFVIGAFLLLGAWRCSRDPRNGRIVLAAAWAFACGMGFASFFGHLHNLHAPDPAGIPHVWVAAIIGCGWALCIVALVSTIVATEGDEPR